MNLLALLFGFVMLLFGLLALVAIPCIWWFARKRTWKFRLAWSVGACLPLLGTMWLWTWLSVYDPTDPEELAKGYEFELHQPFTSDVQDLAIRRVVIGDGVGSWVKFTASPITVDSIIVHFAPSDKIKFHESQRGANVPGWWQPEPDRMANFYYVEHWEEGCSTFSFAYLACNTSRQVVYFHHSGS